MNTVNKPEMPKKNTLRKFKRADLEVSDKIGKGAYGGVWQVHSIVCIVLGCD